MVGDKIKKIEKKSTKCYKCDTAPILFGGMGSHPWTSETLQVKVMRLREFDMLTGEPSEGQRWV